MFGVSFEYDMPQRCPARGSLPFIFRPLPVHWLTEPVSRTDDSTCSVSWKPTDSVNSAGSAGTKKKKKKKLVPQMVTSRSNRVVEICLCSLRYNGGGCHLAGAQRAEKKHMCLSSNQLFCILLRFSNSHVKWSLLMLLLWRLNYQTCCTFVPVCRPLLCMLPSHRRTSLGWKRSQTEVTCTWLSSIFRIQNNMNRPAFLFGSVFPGTIMSEIC